MTAILALVVFNNGTLAEDMVLEEVVVTAQKREQRLQDVPVAVTALTAETIETSGIRETADLTRASASLTYGRGPTPSSAAFRVRGIGTNVISVGLESSVAAVIDGERICVPLDPANRHYAAILEWVAEGNTIQEAD